MINLVDYFKRADLKFPKEVWIGLTVLVKALSQLAILKSVSYYYGSSGVGYLGQALGCITFLSSLLSVGLVNFLITELSGEVERTKRIEIYKTVGFWCMSFQLILILIGVFLSQHLSNYVFDSSSEVIFFIALSFAFLFFNMNSVTQGFLASQKNVKTIFISTATASVISLLVFLIIIFNFNDAIPEAALAFYAAQGLVLFGFFLRNENEYRSLFRPRIYPVILKRVFKFISVMSVTGALGALQQVYIRSYLIDDLGLSWNNVGHWQAVLKISEINLSFIGLTMISLYLPSISSAKTSVELRAIAKTYIKRVFSLVLLGFIFIMFFSKYILLLIFSKDFMFLENLLRIQLFGDIFKLCSWIFTYFFLAKLSIYLFLTVEIGVLLLLTINSIWFSTYYQIEGLIYAQALTSVIFFVLMFFIYNYYSRRDSLWNKSIS